MNERKRGRNNPQCTDDILEKAFRLVHERFGLTEQDILNYAKKREKEEGFPVGILKGPLSALEAIVKYARDEKGRSYKDIGQAIKRNPLNLPRTYADAKMKQPGLFSDEQRRSMIIPFSAFSFRLSILEAICVYLSKMNMSNADIARLIGRDQRTVWTVLARARGRKR